MGECRFEIEFWNEWVEQKSVNGDRMSGIIFQYCEVTSEYWNINYVLLLFLTRKSWEQITVIVSHLKSDGYSSFRMY